MATFEGVALITLSFRVFGQVLKALNPDDWDNASVDEVMAQADKNGDGELSIKEFLMLGL